MGVMVCRRCVRVWFIRTVQELLCVYVSVWVYPNDE